VEQHKAELAFIREEDQKKIDFLTNQVAIKDRQIEWMMNK
jgi:hypothetical protein